LETKNEKRLINYITKNSNLPGRRGNLEMAAAFDGIIREEFLENLEELWSLSVTLTNKSEAEAPTNNPKEMIPFCGTRALGAIGTVSETYFDQALDNLKVLANDTRWRMREAVAAAIGQILMKRGQEGLQTLESWIEKDNWLEMRAIAAGLADASAGNKEFDSQKGLEIHKTIFYKVKKTEDRNNDPLKVLTKGLCYTLSVITQAVPEEGFSYMAHLLDWKDTEITRVVKENLKKNRLKKYYPEEVRRLTKRIQ
ncbi:MAG: HEAT repeat domain-containing protein, partial [Candidatus Hodarchaeales archaeon]